MNTTRASNRAFFSVAAAALLAAGCQNMSAREEGTLKGAGIGAVAGAAIGSVSGHSAGKGALIGAGVGAVAGHQIAKNNAKRKCHYVYR